MYRLGCLAVWALCVVYVAAKPVAKRGPPPPKPVEADSPGDDHTGLEYDNYLKQVVEVLESDPEFRKKLESANVTDIKTGKIAMHLDMVNHTVRTALDEIKRREIQRLQELARLQVQRMSVDPSQRNKIDIPGHLDIRNPHSFEMKDLENLIKKTTQDLEDLDKRRKEEFKEYEMEKKFEEDQRLKHMGEEDRKKEQARLEELKKKHGEHPKLHHPGSKDQFEEVWDKVDHLEDQEFNPRTFFFKHDINGDMEWSIEEVDAILQLELDKVYDSKNSPEEDDPIERQEEMNRMREHVFQEMDKDHNARISYKEFIDYTGTTGENKEFQEDDGWKTLDEEDPVFSDDDYERFLQEHENQPGVIPHPDDDLDFESERHPQQPPQRQQQFQQPPPHGQQQFQQQPPQGQQQFQQQPPQGQQQFQQQPPQGQQQFQQPPPQGQQQFQQPPPQGQQQFEQPQPQVQQFHQEPPQEQQQFQQNQPPQQQQQGEHVPT